MNEPVEKTTITRAHKFVPATRIKRLLESGITYDHLAFQFGNTPNAIKDWIRAGKAPKWTDLAVEAIERRMGKKSKDNLYLLVRISGKDWEAVSMILNKFDADITQLSV